MRINAGVIHYLSSTGCHADAKCEFDVLGFEAINQLHALIDDDHNGNLDRSESNEVSLLFMVVEMSI